MLVELAAICADRPAVGVMFRRLGRFPDVLYLDPEPAVEMQGLTAAIARRWPEALPYGGCFEEIVPHLTVAQGAGDEALATIEREIEPQLPIRADATEAWLYVFDGTRWHPRARLPFGSRRGPAQSPE